MDDLDDLSDEKLAELKKVLEDTTKPAIDRLAVCFCKLGVEFIAFAQAQRAKKGKGKGK